MTPLSIWRDTNIDPTTIDFSLNEPEHKQMLFGTNFGFQTADEPPKFRVDKESKELLINPLVGFSAT